MCYPIRLTAKEIAITKRFTNYFESLHFLDFHGRIFALNKFKDKMHNDPDVDFEEKIFTMDLLQTFIERTHVALRNYNILANEGKVPFDHNVN